MDLGGSKQNVGTNERWASGVGGAALALWGLRRASLPGLLVAATSFEARISSIDTGPETVSHRARISRRAAPRSRVASRRDGATTSATARSTSCSSATRRRARAAA